MSAVDVLSNGRGRLTQDEALELLTTFFCEPAEDASSIMVSLTNDVPMVAYLSDADGNPYVMDYDHGTHFFWVRPDSRIAFTPEFGAFLSKR